MFCGSCVTSGGSGSVWSRSGSVFDTNFKTNFIVAATWPDLRPWTNPGDEGKDACRKRFAMPAVPAARAEMLATEFSNGATVALVRSRPKQLHYEKEFYHSMTAVKYTRKTRPCLKL